MKLHRIPGRSYNAPLEKFLDYNIIFKRSMLLYLSSIF